MAMKKADLARFRLANLSMMTPSWDEPQQVVRKLGAMQAQDYLGSLWSIGQRLKKATEASVENAIANRTILRSWPMRGTLHFVLPENIRWMQRLLTPRVLQRAKTNYRLEGLEPATFRKSYRVIERALRDHRALTRDGLYEALQKANIKLGGQRGLHLLNNAAQQSLICMGPRQGKQHTFVLLDEWVPNSRDWTKEESLAELARLYFTSHGPATLADFCWWSGLSVADAKSAVALVSQDIQYTVVDSQTYWMSKDQIAARIRSPHVLLLSWFDEYIIGYKDRSAAFDPATAKFIEHPKNGIYSPVILIDGVMAGTWRRTFTKDRIEVSTKPFRTLTAKEKEALAKAIVRYKRFVAKRNLD